MHPSVVLLGCSDTLPNNVRLLQMAAQTTGAFTCVKGIQVYNGTAMDAWYTIEIDTVPGGTAGGGGGGPVGPSNTESGWSMETKVMVGWVLLAVLVAAVLAGFWYYQRYRRSQAQLQDGGLLSGGNQQQFAGDGQQYRAMP